MPSQLDQLFERATEIYINREGESVLFVFEESTTLETDAGKRTGEVAVVEHDARSMYDEEADEFIVKKLRLEDRRGFEFDQYESVSPPTKAKLMSKTI